MVIFRQGNNRWERGSGAFWKTRWDGEGNSGSSYTDLRGLVSDEGAIGTRGREPVGARLPSGKVRGVPITTYYAVRGFS